MIKVSVIITTFNAGQSIARTLHSVFAQTGSGKEFELEVIVVDDCSTDNTVDILNQFSIHFYQTSANSGGPNKGRNTGLKHATGDYICLLDHDDTWHPEKIRYQLKATIAAPIVSCHYDVITLHQDSFRLYPLHDRIHRYQANETFLKKLAREKNNIQRIYLSTLMIHRDLKEILFEENFGMLDFDWALRLFENRESAEVPCVLVTRHVHGKNLSLQAEYRKRDYYYSLMLLETFEKKYPKEVSLARRRLNGSRARYYYLMGEMRESRKYLLRARPGIKEIIYYLTSFIGNTWIKKRFSIFG